jgi:hypothetical protein
MTSSNFISPNSGGGQWLTLTNVMSFSHHTDSIRITQP